MSDAYKIYLDSIRKNNREALLPYFTKERFDLYGLNAMDANAAIRQAHRDQLAEGAKLDARYQDPVEYYDRIAPSTMRAMIALNKAEANAGRLLNPQNTSLIRYYAKKGPGTPRTDAQSSLFLGRSSSSPTFLGRGYQQGLGSIPSNQPMPSFYMQTGAPAPAPAPYMPAPIPFSTIAAGTIPSGFPSTAASMQGLMGGGSVHKSTPFRKGGPMDRMVSEMIRNSSR